MCFCLSCQFPLLLSAFSFVCSRPIPGIFCSVHYHIKDVPPPLLGCPQQSYCWCFILRIQFLVSYLISKLDWVCTFDCVWLGWHCWDGTQGLWHTRQTCIAEIYPHSFRHVLFLPAYIVVSCERPWDVRTNKQMV